MNEFDQEIEETLKTVIEEFILLCAALSVKPERAKELIESLWTKPKGSAMH